MSVSVYTLVGPRISTATFGFATPFLPTTVPVKLSCPVWEWAAADSSSTSAQTIAPDRSTPRAIERCELSTVLEFTGEFSPFANLNPADCDVPASGAGAVTAFSTVHWPSRTARLRLAGRRGEERTTRGAEDPSTLDDIQSPSGLARRNPVVAETAADVVLSGLGEMVTLALGVHQTPARTGDQELLVHIAQYLRADVDPTPGVRPRPIVVDRNISRHIGRRVYHVVPPAFDSRGASPTTGAVWRAADLEIRLLSPVDPCGTSSWSGISPLIGSGRDRPIYAPRRGGRGGLPLRPDPRWQPVTGSGSLGFPAACQALARPRGAPPTLRPAHRG